MKMEDFIVWRDVFSCWPAQENFLNYVSMYTLFCSYFFGCYKLGSVNAALKAVFDFINLEVSMQS